VAFRAIRVYNFRNLSDAVIRTDAREIFLVGENGQGKTNFLEAVYYVCYASSFRTRRDDVLRRQNESEMAVEGRFESDALDHTILIKQSGRSKEILFDGSQVTDRKEIIANVPCIVFCHDDIDFVTGSPDMQRWFFNQTQSLIDPPFVTELRAYTRILKNRNAALKDNRISLLDVLDQQLAQAGVLLQEKRQQLSAAFAGKLHELFLRVFQEDRELSLHYRPSWQADMEVPAIQELLLENRERDLDQRTSTRGPHRDKFLLYLDGSPVNEVASTGQLRLVSLILRVAQAHLLASQTGRNPVLLLDDVLLELDPARRARFLDALPEYEQAFFTFLPDEQYARLRKESTRTFTVEAGIIAAS
jgi:DNA replication and repair protein RecF